jgi:quercetin dioxygenase-like cupin family protein
MPSDFAIRSAIRSTIVSGLLLLPLACACAQDAPAPAAGIKRTQVYKGPVAASDHEAVLVKAELAVGAHAGRHTHPGDEISYVAEGETELLIDGQPPLRLKAGQGFSVPAGTVHDARNVGDVPVRLIGVYVVEKGKPLATPAK